MFNHWKRILFVTSICLFLIILTGAGQQTIIKVLHAGSLSIPLENVAQQFEAENPGVEVRLESHGSVLAVRQITEVGKKADVIAVADYSLIPSMMYPTYADFYLQFARNRMVLAYTESSEYANSVNTYNWYNVLRKDEVNFGFSNPNLDPCGYRSPMVLQLAELFYMDENILDDLVIDNSAIQVDEDQEIFTITSPEALKPNTSKLSIRPKSVELITHLQSGGLDYAFEYMSVAKQHGLKWVTLPEEIDLSTTEYADLYKKVRVETSDGNLKVGKPIVYGISVPTNSPNPDWGMKFVKFVIGKVGQKIFTELGQPPITPPVKDGNIPDDLK